MFDTRQLGMQLTTPAFRMTSLIENSSKTFPWRFITATFVHGSTQFLPGSPPLRRVLWIATSQGNLQKVVWVVPQLPRDSFWYRWTRVITFSQVSAWRVLWFLVYLRVFQGGWQKKWKNRVLKYDKRAPIELWSTSKVRAQFSRF